MNLSDAIGLEIERRENVMHEREIDLEKAAAKRIGELQSQVEALTAEVEEQARLLGKSGSREAELLARIEALETGLSSGVTGDTSDGYHTFNELYEFRKLYNAALFNEWAAQGKYIVHKSKRHNDGGECFGGGWFIVVAMLPTGQISNHYKDADWNLFNVPVEEKAIFQYDGHTGADVIERLTEALLQEPTK